MCKRINVEECIFVWVLPAYVFVHYPNSAAFGYAVLKLFWSRYTSFGIYMIFFVQLLRVPAEEAPGTFNIFPHWTWALLGNFGNILWCNKQKPTNW